MADLSKLCSICYAEAPKYRCPRCKIQTCSLPCYKKHQQRASCSGKRDPASYLKKSQLATPTGLDQDYNYLRSIERSIGQASEQHQQSGGGHANYKNVSSGWRTESKLQKYLTENQITRERAPHGMSRQRENTTRATKTHDALWTVEWRGESGERELQHDCEGTSTLAHLYSRLQKSKRRAAVAAELKPAQDRPSKRRKQEAQHASESEPAPEASSANDAAKLDLPSAANAPRDSSETQEVTTALEETGNTKKQQYFYLLKPGTASSSNVMLPMDTTASLTQSLKGHAVLEFPTLYVLDQEPTSLPEGFILAHDYERRVKAESAELQSLDQASRTSQPPPNQRLREQQSGNGRVDAKSILDMLKRDVRT